MSLHESDISWQMLRQIVHDWSGTTAELDEVKPLIGGCINTTLALTTKDGQKAVLKIAPHRVNRQYVDEAYQLNVLREIGLPAPRVYSCKVGSLEDPFSYLLMEYMPGVDFSQARQQCSPEDFDHLQQHLADLLLRLHGNTASHYQRVIDGKREEFDAWPKFYRKVYDLIWHECEKTHLLPKKACKQVGKIHEKLDRFVTHGDVPRLVHWDIWSTNLLAAPDEHGKWWVTGILDPNCKYAHAEAEIAYMELFHTITPAFLRAYQSAHKLPAEYHAYRKPIYQLYPLINHVRLFGQEYLKPLLAAVERVAAFI